MKKAIAVSVVMLFMVLRVTSSAWALTPAAPKIQIEMSSAGPSQTTLEIAVKAPDGSYSYTYNYSIDGGATWILGVDGNLTLNNGLHRASWVADNYTNVLIRVTAHVGADTKTSYTMAYPPNPSGHSNYSTNTNLCKNCHTTHTAVGKKLLAQANIENLCTTCHGSTANGAKYLVVAGEQVVNAVYSRAPSLGGGFPADGDTRHSYRETDAAAFPPGGKPGSSIKMSCVSCHQGHAASNSDNYNYRLLKTSVTENTYIYNTQVVGIFAKANPGEGDTYATVDAATTWTPLAAGISNFCGSCHNDYNVTGTGDTGSANTIASVNQDGKAVFEAVYYRHPVDVTLDTLIGSGQIDPTAVTLPLFSKKITCLTCHKAHGSSATQEGSAKNYLLRLNNRAVCENCHQK